MSTFELPDTQPENPIASLGEKRAPQERESIASLRKLMLGHMEREYGNSRVRVAKRGVHATGHGTVYATVEVAKTIPADLQVGPFSTPGRKYKAWIRFSSGDGPAVDDERVFHSRGMAIKLLDVDEAPELNEEENKGGPRTMDLLMTNRESFFVKNIDDYAVAFPFGKGTQEEKGRALLGVVTRKKELIAGQFARKKVKDPINPVGIQYWSKLPHRWGDVAVKYSAKPTQKTVTKARKVLAGLTGERTEIVDEGANEFALLMNSARQLFHNVAGGLRQGLGFVSKTTQQRLEERDTKYLTKGLKAALSDEAGDTVVQFDLQVQRKPESVDLEDATQSWAEAKEAKEGKQVPVTVAVITIPNQDVDKNRRVNGRNRKEFGEQLAFNPWRAPKEFRPLGSLNRGRKVLYDDIARMRRFQKEAQRVADSKAVTKIPRPSEPGTDEWLKAEADQF